MFQSKRNLLNQLKATRKGECSWRTFCQYDSDYHANLMVTKSRNGVAHLEQLQQL
jgi:hypothetical protein